MVLRGFWKLSAMGALCVIGVISQGTLLAQEDSSTTLLLTGSSTVAPLVQHLAKEFEKENPKIRVDVQTGGSSKGVADCLKGLNAFGMVSRDLKPEEKGAEAISLANDGLAFLLRSDLAVESLTPENIVRIYKGEVSNWKEFGGRDEAIVAVSKAEGRGTFDLFKAYFELKSSEIKAGLIVGDEAHAVKTISSNQGAIGFLSVTSAKQATASKDSGLRILSISGKGPSSSTLKDGTYPYTRKLQLVKCRAPSEAGSKFVDFALSEKGQKIVESVGYVSL